MSCWRRTTVLRIPALYLGFEYLREWNQFLREHDEQLDWDPGWFGPALCENSPEWYPGLDDFLHDPDRRLDARDPGHPEYLPGPFLDYHLEEILPLPPDENSYHENDIARPLTREEKEKYLPLFRDFFPRITLADMDHVHYCRYEWYDGAEAAYLY